MESKYDLTTMMTKCWRQKCFLAKCVLYLGYCCIFYILLGKKNKSRPSSPHFIIDYWDVTKRCHFMMLKFFGEFLLVNDYIICNISKLKMDIFPGHPNIYK